MFSSSPLNQYFWILILVLVVFPNTPAHAQVDSASESLTSLDSLLNLKVSTASKYEQTAREIPASITIVTREEIGEYGFMSLMEILSMVRSTYISDDREYQRLGVRGFSRPGSDNNRVLLMIDGHVYNENIFGGANLGPELLALNVRRIERVEFIRGPSSALYGNNALLGVINIITNRGKNINGLSLDASSGSFGLLQSGFIGGFKKGDFEVQFSGQGGRTTGQQLYYEEYDDSTSDGIADKVDGMMFGGLSTRMTYKGLTLNIMGGARSSGIPTGNYETLFNDPRARTKDQRGFVELGYQKDLSPKLNFSADISLDGYIYDADFPYDSITDVGLSTEGARGFWTTLETMLRYDIKSNSRLLVGGQYQYNFRAHFFALDPTEVYFNGDIPYQTFGVYAQNEWEPLQWLSVIIGGRFDYAYLGKTALTPKLAFNFFVTPKLTLKALYSEAFRAPPLFEVNADDNGNIVPNLSLIPERIRALEFSMENRISKKLWLVGSVYDNRMINLIDPVVDTVDYSVQKQNVGVANALGIELEANVRLSKRMKLYGNYGLQYSYTNSTSEELSNSPRHLLKFGGSVGFLKHFRIASDMQYQSSRITVYDEVSDPFFLVNANLSFAPQSNSTFLNRFLLNLRVRNILNSSYGYPAGYDHLQTVIQQDGINFVLRLQADIF